jgi:hypothetical protein
MDVRASSNRELARQIGVSETAVRRAEKAARIGRDADGSWDLTKVQAAWSSNTDPSQQRRHCAKPARTARMPVPDAAVGAVRETLREHGESVSAGGMTFVQARTANEVLKAQERRVRLQRMKAELVDRAKAVAQVFKLAREERDAWVNWPARVAAMMASELEVDTHELHTALERHVRDHLDAYCGQRVFPNEAPSASRFIPLLRSAIDLHSARSHKLQKSHPTIPQCLLNAQKCSEFASALGCTRNDCVT